MIERNTTIPTERKEIFSTAADNQTAVTVSVFQGERKMARDNRLLGQFNLEGIPPAPRGVPQIEVNFDIDANGILKVSASDIGSGKEQTVRIEKSSGLSESEIDRMQKDAESHADEDQRKRKLAEARNQAARLVYQMEKVHEGACRQARCGVALRDRVVDRASQQGDRGRGHRRDQIGRQGAGTGGPRAVEAHVRSGSESPGGGAAGGRQQAGNGHSADDSSASR